MEASHMSKAEVLNDKIFLSVCFPLFNIPVPSIFSRNFKSPNYQRFSIIKNPFYIVVFSHE